MKKFALVLCLLALGGPSWADQEKLSRQFYQQCSNLKNTATALEMWASDHDGTYPEDLSQLTPNYLRHLLPGPQGSSQEIVYLVDQNHEHYQLKVIGNSFKEIQIAGNYPQYGSDHGLLLNDTGKIPTLPLNLLNPDLDASWQLSKRPMGLKWTRGSEQISSSLQLTQLDSEAERRYTRAYYNEDEVIDGERTNSNGERIKLVHGRMLAPRQNSKPVPINYLELRSLQGDALRVLKYETESSQIDPAVTQEFKRMLAGQ